MGFGGNDRRGFYRRRLAWPDAGWAPYYRRHGARAAGADERDAIILNTAHRDSAIVKISLPQDPGQAGKTLATHHGRLLSGFNFKTSPESGSKETRAEPFAAQVNVGNVLMLRGAWNGQLIEEMRMFPNGRHDDQVDALSRAFGELITPPGHTFGFA
jgi:predicted phage terminase large subunit-like protein